MQSPTLEHVKNFEIVRAGAGAGKTYTLTHKVMDVAADMQRREKRWPRLVVTTFTRKATQELRERLMLLALDEYPEMVDFINSRSSLVVSTIHGVMDLFLKRYGGKIGIDPSYKVIGPAEASKIARQVLRDNLLSRDDAQDSLQKYSFNHLIKLFRRLDGLQMESPEARPFELSDFEEAFGQEAEKLARELKSVAFKIKEESAKADWLAMADDFLALAGHLLGAKEESWAARYSSFETTLLSMKTARRNAKAPPVTDQTAEEAEVLRKNLKEFLQPYFDPNVWPHFANEFATLKKFATEFSSAFRKAKLAKGLLEISDLETFAMDCLRSYPETAVSFSQDWDYWLIDEYQDTSPFQVELLRALSGRSPNFIVGDPQQSIYLFRGARSEVFAIKEQEILANEGKQSFLKTNRRSQPELLIFLNDFFSRLETPFEPMHPFVKEGAAILPSHLAATIFIDTTLTSDDEEDDGLGGRGDDDESRADSVPASSSDDLELRALLAHVQKLITDGTGFDEICILGRTNQVLAEIATLLNRYNLPTHVHASSGFFDRREIRDALALLKFLVNPHDNFNLIEVLRSPWFRLSDDVLVESLHSSRASHDAASAWDRILSSVDRHDPIQRLQKLAELARSIGVSEAFRAGLVSSGFIDLAHQHDLSGRRESNLWKLLAKLQQEEGRSGFNPISFITAALHDLKVDESNSEGDAVAAVEPNRINLMTVHASKGLEFKHVCLPRMHQKPRLTASEEFTFDEDARRWAIRVPFGDDGEMIKSLPEVLWLRKFQAQELKEHARILYVALTRAIDSVYLSWKAKVQKNSWADMIRIDVAPGEHQTDNYRYLVTSEIASLMPPRDLNEERVQIRAPFVDRHSESNLTVSMSVTDMLERANPRNDGALKNQAGLESAALGSENPTSDLKAITHRVRIASEGTAVHRLMELLKYPSQIRLQQIVEKWFPGREGKILGAVEYVRDCQAPPLLEIIKNGFVEWGFAMLHEGVLIEGQLDLWGRTNNGAVWIVDYKTGSPEYREKAFEQMALYSIALRKSNLLKPRERIQMAAVYPFSQLIYTRSLDGREDDGAGA